MTTGTEMQPRLPGMHDVARLAGVSHMTVSRVVNDHPSVSLDVRVRVLKAIADLGYRRNSAARALVTRRSSTIGVVTMTTTLFGPTSTLLSVEAAAREAGFFVSLASAAVADEAHLVPTFEHFVDQAVEGIVVIAPAFAVAAAAQTFAPRMPLVMVADVPRASELHSVAVDQRLGARLAVRHLVGLGHVDIAHIAGPSDFFDGRARVQGWRQELRAHGLQPGFLARGDWSAESGYRCGKQILKTGVPDAVFAGNDLMALGTVRALTDAGLSVPDDVSVVGFDDIDGADFFQPPLTTVRQDFAGLGQRCILAMVELIKGAEVARRSPIPPTLIVRGSTAEKP